jgi:predicted MFS family arabinose efflux permease
MMKPDPPAGPASAAAARLISGRVEHLSAPVAQTHFARHTTLMVLTAVNAIGLLDRQAMGLVQEFIKRDLGLFDTQLGLLTGFAFSIVYVFAAIPIARLADRSIRRDIIAVALAFWSAMTALTGLAQNFAHLSLTRMGVALGEAGCIPPAHSIISDHYPQQQRAGALSFYTIGSNIGMLLGFVILGALCQAVGWRMTFLIIGLPGLAVSILLRTLIREPERSTKTVTANITLREVVIWLGRRSSIRWTAGGLIFSALTIFAIQTWTAPLLSRMYHMSITEIGLWLAGGLGLGGIVGGAGAGLISDRLGRRDTRWYLWIPAAASTIMVPFLWGALSVKGAREAALLLMLPCALGTCYAGCVLAVLHGIALPRMRATTSALFLFISNIFGIGLGAFLIGLISDLLKPRFGDTSLQHALQIILPAATATAALFYVLGSRAIDSDLRQATHD